MRRLCLHILTVAVLLSGCSGVFDDRYSYDKSVILGARKVLRRGFPDKARHLTSYSDAVPLDSAGMAVWGESYESEDDWINAADVWRSATSIYPEVISFYLHYWQSLLAIARSDSGTADSLRSIVRSHGDSLASVDSFREMLLSYRAAALLEDSIARERGDRLIATYPDSQEIIDLVGERFWNGLYPVWNDNEGRVKYLTEFIRKYHNFSWKNTAWKNLIATYKILKDTTSLVRETADWVYSAHDDPYVLVSAASFMMDCEQLDSARIWISQAYRLKEKLVRPSHIPEEEWLLYGPQLKAQIPLILAEINLSDGGIAKAMKLAEESLELAVYGVDEYATRSAQHYLLGRIYLANDDTNIATDHLIKALEEGEVRNHHPSLADSLLRALHNIDSDTELPEFCRKWRNYSSICFTRVTNDAGLGEARGGRFAWGDYDGDDDDDLLVNGSRLYHNDEGHFNEVTAEVGLNAMGCSGGIWGDYDADGDLDLFCFSSSGDLNKAERLFRNRGDGTFEDMTTLSGEIQDTFSTEAAIWGYFNDDDLLDLFVPGYEKPGDAAADLGRGWRDRLLIQGEEGIFHDKTLEARIIPPHDRHLCGRSPVTCDFDRDGDLDLYVGNYRLQQNLFWINDGYGRFENQAAWLQVDGEQVDGWWGHSIGSQWGDFDNDGDFDLIVCNLAHPRYIKFSNRTMLYRNDGTKKGFTNVRRMWKIKYDECHSEPVWGDLDNDGDLDLFITSVYPNRRSYLYRNDRGRFTDVTYLSGTRIFNGWGCALSDYDNDGDLDLVTRNNGRVELFRNDSKCGNWVEIVADPLRVGTIVELQVPNKTFIRQIEGGKGAGSQSSMVLHFGIGKDKLVDAFIYSEGIRKGPLTVKPNSKARL